MNGIEIQHIGQLISDDFEYARLVSLISDLWEDAKAKAAIAVYTEPLDPETAKRYMKYIPAWA